MAYIQAAGHNVSQIIIQYTSPIWNQAVYDNDDVVDLDTGNLNLIAVVVHDGDIIRVDLDNNGTFEINPPGT